MKALVRNLLKVFNPVIWLLNVFRYFAHLNSQGPIRYHKDYEPYDFKDDIKYF